MTQETTVHAIRDNKNLQNVYNITYFLSNLRTFILGKYYVKRMFCYKNHLYQAILFVVYSSLFGKPYPKAGHL